MITVFSPKGGTGKTVTATNLSVCFAKNAGKKTLLLDLDLQFGDAAIMLGIEPEKTIQDLVTAPGELDPEKLAGYTTRHSSGLDVLPAPIRPEDAELVTEAKLARLMEVAKESYEVIVVDTSPFFHGPMLATLDQYRRPAPRLRARRADDQERPAEPPDAAAPLLPVERVRVVLNRANSNVGMKKGEVEAALETKIRFEVPSDRAVPLAVNRSNPAVLSDPKSDFGRALREMAKSLMPAQAAAERHKRRFLGKNGS